METINKAVPTGLCETAESETINAEIIAYYTVCILGEPPITTITP